ncbi:MAG: hypothetical protein ABI690_05315 [Chloroflexota bacterium]
MYCPPKPDFRTLLRLIVSEAGRIAAIERKYVRAKYIRKKGAKMADFWRKFRLFSKTGGSVVVDEGNFRTQTIEGKQRNNPGGLLR